MSPAIQQSLGSILHCLLDLKVIKFLFTELHFCHLKQKDATTGVVDCSCVVRGHEPLDGCCSVKKAHCLHAPVNLSFSCHKVFFFSETSYRHKQYVMKTVGVTWEVQGGRNV